MRNLITKRKRKRTEHNLQENFNNWLRYQYPKEYEICYAIPNGGSRHPIEAINLKRTGTKAGIPDFCIPIARKGYHGLYIEFKSPDKKPTPLQQSKLNRLREEGYMAECCDDFDKASELVRGYLG